ncbi:MAG TPA: DUF3078 domain-containing protein [Prolixibacteraceae bacterium]|nr:DUF3078 domain-containing protein [Prolixibacteraceae bacterium]
MKKIVTLLIGIFLFVSLFAQEKKDTTYWKTGGMFSVNFNQISFTNWAAGGLNSVSGVAKAQYSANYLKANISWDNLLDLGYGLSKVQGLVVQKNEDVINLESKLGIKAANKWFYSGMLNFKSQFAPGYSDKENKNLISNFLSPAYLFLSVGMDYKPSGKFSLMLSPLTGKITIVTDDSLRANYGVDVDKVARPEFGAYLKSSLNTEIVKNVGLLTELGLFSNYLKDPEKVDVDWKVAINMKVNKYISAQLGTNLIYDYDIKDPVDGKAKVQFKELFGVGFSFKF